MSSEGTALSNSDDLPETYDAASWILPALDLHERPWQAYPLDACSYFAKTWLEQGCNSYTV